jgi:hypothetical protein
MGVLRAGWGRLAVIGVVVGVLAAPAVVWAGQSRFVDVSDASPFVGDIEWLADAGVTRGCNPPDNDRFCPKDYVTREQMAAFMHRQAGYFDGDGNGVVDIAESLGGYYPWDLSFGYGLIDEQPWDGFSSPDWAIALELAVQPPSDGMVVLTGIIDYGSSDDISHNLVAVACTDVTCGTDNWGADVETPHEAQIVTTAVLPVQGGGDTLRIWVRAPNGGPVRLYRRNLTALFMPFGFAVECDADGACATLEP